MLRLFPRSWFNRASTTQRRHAEQVDALQTHWRTWLAKGIARIVADDSIDGSSAVARLEDLSPTQLLELDRVLRFGWWDMGDGPGQLLPMRLVPIDGRRPEDDAFLFVASSHPNGFVREQAVLTLKHYPGRLALAAALIRCDDWVHEVRVAASELLVHLTGESPGDDLIALLPLVSTRPSASQRSASHIRTCQSAFSGTLASSSKTHRRSADSSIGLSFSSPSSRPTADHRIGFSCRPCPAIGSKHSPKCSIA